MAIVAKEILSISCDLKEFSKILYPTMHKLDQQNLDLITAEKLPNFDLGKSINDKLQ